MGAVLLPIATVAMGAAPARTLWVDLNTDDYPDLIRFVAGGRAQYLLNDRAGGFEPASGIELPAPLHSATLQDLDHDGTPELILGGEEYAYVVGLDADRPELLYRIPAGGAVEVTDYDLDGEADLLVGDRLFRWDGGDFAAVELPPLGSDEPAELEAADLDMAPAHELGSTRGADDPGELDSRPDRPTGPAQIADGAVSSAKLADGAVQSRHLSSELRYPGGIFGAIPEDEGSARVSGAGSNDDGADGVVIAGTHDAKGVSGDLVVGGDLRVHGAGVSSFDGGLGVGTPAAENPLTVETEGTDVGGRSGFDQVVARFRDTDSASAIAVDADAGANAQLYLSEAGNAQWAIANRADEDRFEIARLEADGSTVSTRITVEADPTGGHVGIGTENPRVPVEVIGAGTNSGGGYYDEVVARFTNQNTEPFVSSAIAIDHFEAAAKSSLYFSRAGEAKCGFEYRSGAGSEFEADEFRIGYMTSFGLGINPTISIAEDGDVGIGGNVAIGSAAASGIPLDVAGLGSDLGSLPGESHVVTRVKNSVWDHSALSIDSQGPLDSRLYLSNDGVAQWSIGNRAAQGNQLEIAWADPDAANIVPVITIDDVSSTAAGGIYVKVGGGTGVPKNLLDVRGEGTDVGGVPDKNQVVARFKNGEDGLLSAISVDGQPGLGARIYLAESGQAEWALLNKPTDESKFKIAHVEDDGEFDPALTITTRGKVGIGANADSPEYPLHVNGEGVDFGTRFNNVSAQLAVSSDGFAGGTGIALTTNAETGRSTIGFGYDDKLRFSLGRHASTSETFRLNFHDDDDTTILFSASPTSQEFAVTKLRVWGGADLVEDFDAAGVNLVPGSVVVFDPDDPRTIAQSVRPYDRRVAGIVSGAGGLDPGLHLGSGTEISGDTPVAMAGRVYVRCTSENGPIRPGDLLTTSSTPGVAMRATDRARAPGAVVAKAIDSLEAGEGLVLALVALQ